MAEYYEKINWQNGAEGETPLSAENLSHMEEGISSAEMRAGSLEYDKETNSLAMDGCLSGGRGYVYYAINIADKKIFLEETSTELSNTIEILTTEGDVPTNYENKKFTLNYKTTEIDDNGNEVTLPLRNRRFYLRFLADGHYNNLILTDVGEGYISYEVEENTIFNPNKTDTGYHYLIITSQSDIGPVVITQAGLATGYNAVATGSASIASGQYSIASGNYSIAIGNRCFAGYGSIATGYSCEAIGNNSSAEGGFTKALGKQGHAEGTQTQAIGANSHAEGNLSIASGSTSHVEGYSSQAYNESSHAEGYSCIANGQGAHAEGNNTNAKGLAAHAEGDKVVAEGNAAHAEGSWLQSDYTSETYAKAGAFANYAHSEGQTTQAKGIGSHAEGRKTISEGIYSHAEGSETKASGTSSHSEGQNTTAKGSYSHAGGHANTAYGTCETVIGKFSKTYPNIAPTEKNYLFRIGNGTGDGNLRSDALTVDWSGNLKIAGQLQDMNGNNLLASNELMPFMVDGIEYYCPWGMTWEHLQYYKSGEIWNALGLSIIDNSYVGKNGRQIEELIYFPDGSTTVNENIYYYNFIGHKNCRNYTTIN